MTTDAPDWFHPGRSGVLRLGPQALASFGDIHPGVLRAMDIDGPAVGMVVNLHMIPTPKQKKAKSGGAAARPLLTLSPFQPVHRDFAFVVDSDVAAGDIVRAASGVDRALITDVQVFDVYEGEHVGEGKKSIAIAVTLQPVDATLTDEQIDAVAGKITADVEKTHGRRAAGLGSRDQKGGLQRNSVLRDRPVMLFQAPSVMPESPAGIARAAGE